jgi:hypothetical protein
VIFFADTIHSETDFGADYGAGFDDHFPGDISTIDGASEIATSSGKKSRNESPRPTSRRPSTGSVIEEPEMLRAVFDSFSQDDLLHVGTSRQEAEILKQHVHEGVERLRQEKERATSEFQKLKASASVDVEIITTMFLANFEQFCKNEAHLQIQHDMMTNERREHETLYKLMKGKNVELLEFAAKTKKELVNCRSKVDYLAKIVKEYQGENQKLFQVSQALILGLLEDRQKQHDASIQNLSSQFAKTLSEKNQELAILNKSIEDKEACVVILSQQHQSIIQHHIDEDQVRTTSFVLSLSPSLSTIFFHAVAGEKYKD